MLFFKNRKQKSEKELEELLEGYELPSFPGIVMEVLSLLRDHTVSMKKIADSLTRDPGMHVKILKTVNSAAFGLSKKISNIHYAVNLLGKSRIESILLTHAVKDNLPEIHLNNLDVKQFWFIASFRASLARTLAEQLHPATKHEAFTAGLLQDMAIPVIAMIKHKDYDDLLKDWYSNGEPNLAKLELEKFGFNHQTVGQLMAKKWDFPEYLINAITFHHDRSGDISVDPSVWLVSHLKNGKDNTEFSLLIDLCEKYYLLEPEKMEASLQKSSEEAEQFYLSLN